MKRWLLCSTLLVLLSACSGGSHQTAGAPTAGPALHNPIDFPLYSPSRVLAAKDFTQTVNTNGAAGGVLNQGNGTYSGNEIVASTPASLNALSSWLHGLSAKPPSHYQHYNLDKTGDTRAIGLDYDAFQTTQGGKPVALLVVVMDPARVTQRLGPALSLVATYRNLPQMMRAPIDQKFQEQTGISISEALQPQSPLGLVLDSLSEFAHNNNRAILLLNAHKN